MKANVVILTEGESQALVADLKGFEKRGIEEPAAEISVRGPRRVYGNDKGQYEPDSPKNSKPKTKKWNLIRLGNCHRQMW